ncbi:MAG: hypothetical protein ACRDZW_05775, partial [Acidimicrobiales bacterium]
LTLAEGPARPQVVGDGVVINLVPRSDTGPAAFVVTGGEIQVDGGVLRAGAFQPPVSYEVHDSPVWTETIDRLYHGPVARELRSLALDGEMPTPVLRRFAVEGANWLSRGPFDLPAHLAVQLAGLPPDKRDKAMAATAAAVTLVLERLLTKATSSASPA